MSRIGDNLVVVLGAGLTGGWLVDRFAAAADPDRLILVGASGGGVPDPPPPETAAGSRAPVPVTGSRSTRRRAPTRGRSGRVAA